MATDLIPQEFEALPPRGSATGTAAALGEATAEMESRVRQLLPGTLRVTTPDQARTAAMGPRNALYQAVSVTVGMHPEWDELRRVWVVELRATDPSARRTPMPTHADAAYFEAELTATTRHVGAIVIDEEGRVVEATAEDEIFAKVSELQRAAPPAFPERTKAQSDEARVRTPDAAQDAIVAGLSRQYAGLRDLSVGPVIRGQGWEWVAALRHTHTAEAATVDYVRMDARTGEITYAPSPRILRAMGVKYVGETADA